MATPQVLATSMKCPRCNQEIDGYAEVNTDRPFTATSPFEGLNAWGPFSAEKVIRCRHGQYVHFEFVDTREHRLVKMTQAPSEP